MEEPIAPHQAARPCAVPHSAPPAWLRSAAQPTGESFAPPGEQPAELPPRSLTREQIVDYVLADPDLVDQILRRAAPARHVGGRADGWNGERMAAFLQTLADTGLITQACRIAGMSRDAAYALRNRDRLFEAAWAAAQSKARPLVADGLLERSITGTVEHYYRDGVLVGERRHYESWLGLAVLKRLDKQAAEHRADANLASRVAADWQSTLDALREGGSDAASAMLEAKADKADTPPSPPGCSDSDNVWQDDNGTWITTFPPPYGFEGYEKGTPNGFDYYERACTSEEVEALEGSIAAEDVEMLADQERARDSYFASLRAQTAAALAKAGRASPRTGDCGSAAPPVERGS